MYTESVSPKNLKGKWGWICKLAGEGHCEHREAPNMLVYSLMETILA